MHIVFGMLLCYVSSNAQNLDVAELKLDTNYLKLGQQTLLKFSVTTHKSRKPVLPVWKNVLDKKLDIISEGDVDTLSITESKLKVRQELIVAKFNEDTLILDSLRIPLVKGRDTIIVESNSLTVYPILENVDLDKDIRDIKSPEEIPFNWREILPYIILFVGILILILIIYLLVRLIKKRRKKKAIETEPDIPVVKIPAHIIALEKLDELKRNEKWFTMDSKGYMSDLTDIIREYISNRWGFEAMESTSEEILSAPFIVQIEHDHLQHLKELLAKSDFVKFAKASTSNEENKWMLDQSILFVEMTKMEEESNG